MGEYKLVFLYACDDNFAGVLACSLTSLLVNGNAVDSEIVIVSDGISIIHKEMLNAIAKKHNVDLCFLDMPKEKLMSIGTIDVRRYSISMFSRIFADTLLPTKNRVIYLDCDTMILQDIRPLWETDMSGLPVGAVNDFRSKEYKRNLGMGIGSTYINSGVLLIDLDAYRKNKCADRLLDALKVGNGLLEFPDNDLICSVLENEIFLLPCKYNAISSLFLYSYNELIKYRRPELPPSVEEHKECINDPTIVHFTSCFLSKGRPWEKGCVHPYVNEYKKVMGELSNDFSFPASKQRRSKSVFLTTNVLPRKILMQLSGIVHSSIKPKLKRKGQIEYCRYIKSLRPRTAVILRTQSVEADSRAEKEAYSLCTAGYIPVFLGWNRDEKGKTQRKIKAISGKQVALYQIKIKGKYFQGFIKNLIPMATFQVKMKKWLKANIEDIDIIHACDLDTALFTASFARRKNIPLIYDIYDYYPDGHANQDSLMYRFLTALERRTEKKASAVIVCTEKRLEQIDQSICARTAVIHNALPAQYAENITNKSWVENNGKIHFVFVGAIIRGRYLTEMIRVIASKSESCDMYVGGFGADKLVADVIRMAKENSNIHFLGFLPYKDVIALESSCDIIPAVFDPSIGNHRYAAPNKFYEAVMLGKPLIMLKNTGMDRWVSQCGIGEVISGCTSEEFIGEFSLAVDKLISEREVWGDIAYKEKKLYEERFSWDIMHNRLINLYNEVQANGERNSNRNTDVDAIL